MDKVAQLFGIRNIPASFALFAALGELVFVGEVGRYLIHHYNALVSKAVSLFEKRIGIDFNLDAAEKSSLAAVVFFLPLFLSSLVEFLKNWKNPLVLLPSGDSDASFSIILAQFVLFILVGGTFATSLHLQQPKHGFLSADQLAYLLLFIMILAPISFTLEVKRQSLALPKKIGLGVLIIIFPLLLISFAMTLPAIIGFSVVFCFFAVWMSVYIIPNAITSICGLVLLILVAGWMLDFGVRHLT